MNTRNNVRFRDNQTAIEDAVLTLLERKDTEEITVKEICDMTGINRSTFYRHFIDIYDLYDKVQERIFGDWFQSMPQEKLDGFETDTGKMNMVDDGTLRSLFSHVKKYPSFYRVYLMHHRDNIYGEKFAEIWSDYFIPLFQYNGIEDERQMTYYYAFFRSGIVEVILMWLNDGCRDDIDMLMDTVKAYSKVGLVYGNVEKEEEN